MKKVMLRMKGRIRRGDSHKFLKTLEYGVWYNFVTPFGWQYFKIKKGSRYVHVYDFIGDKKPQYTFSRKHFLEDIIWWAKGPVYPVNFEEVYIRSLV